MKAELKKKMQDEGTAFVELLKTANSMALLLETFADLGLSEIDDDNLIDASERVESFRLAWRVWETSL